MSVVNPHFLKKYEERVVYSKKVIKSFWNFEKLPYIPTLVWLPPYYSLRNGLLTTAYEYYTNDELALRVQIESIKERLEVLEDDYIPYLDSYMGTCVLASAFGGGVRYFENQDPWVARAVVDDYRDIDRIKKPRIKESEMIMKVINRIDFWKKEVGDTIPISMPDPQGPLSIAIDLMGMQNLYLGFFDDPSRMHKLLEMITELIIDFQKVLYPRLESEDGVFEWTGIFFPKSKGRIRISEDNLISISPELYTEFAQPYNEIILRELGGGIIHWCGNGQNNFENVLSTSCLTGIHNSTMGDISLIFDQIVRIQEKNRNEHKNLVYFSSMVTPSRKSWIAGLLKRQKGFRGVINQVFFSTSKYGIMFIEGADGGYERFQDDQIDIIKEFFKQK